MRVALSLSKQQAIAVNAVLDKPVDPEAAESDSPSDDGGTELVAPDRDETGQPSADGAGDEDDLLADDGDPNERDPLTEFVEECN